MDDAEGLLSDLRGSAPVLVVAFGGLAMRVAGMPPFEFFRMLGNHGSIKKVFVRDHYHSWYHRGVRGLADDIEGVTAELQHRVGESGASKIVTLGSSAGGYAALLFGLLLGADEVHAFGAQTFISPSLRQHHGDCRFQNALNPLLSSGYYRPEYADLEGIFLREGTGKTQFYVHYCEGNALDAIHAAHLQPQPGVSLRCHPGDEHNVVKYLHEVGDLAPLLEQIVSP